MPTGFKMVRLPDELADKITAAGHKREPFVRGAVEAALGEGLEPHPATRGDSERVRSPQVAPAPPRPSGPSEERVREAMSKAPVEYIGCERHPEAGARRGLNGRWWCADITCIKPAGRRTA